MPLTLRAVSLNDQPITQPIVASFGSQGGSLGRADTNTLALPDPERRISRLQAEIRVVGSGYVIKNVGAANPIIVRDESLTQGKSAPLRHGDQLRIGGYLLEVACDDGFSDDRTTIEANETPSDPFASLQPPMPVPRPSAARKPSPGSTPPFPASSPFADLEAPISAANPFAELLGDSKSASSSQSSSLPRETAGASSRLPDDFDPFATPAPSEPPSPSPTTSTAGGVFDDLIPNVAPASIDSLISLNSADARDPLAAFMAGAPAGKPEAVGSLPTDPLALFGSEKYVRSSSAPSETSPDQTPELRAAFVPPKPRARMPAGLRSASATALNSPADVVTAPVPAPAARAAHPGASVDAATEVAVARPRARSPATPVPSTASAEEPTVPPATGWSADALATWNYLCEGAGVRLDPPPNTGPAFMRVVGMMLRAAVEGTVQQMAVRQATRQELQAQVTVIRPKNNNPLKFAPDGQSAMEQVLQPAVRGFLPGPAAMTDAMNDLLGHAIGTMAGTRAALEGVLKRFGPQELEAKLASKSVLDSVLPMNRKAKLWELYLQHYGSIRDEAQEDFHTLFGRAFLAAYEQQLERLRRNKAASPAPPK
jgi:FHA domain-containing protein